jgi:hypothetical protein
MGGLNSLSSSIQSITNALTSSQVAASTKGLSKAALPPPPRYSFEIWDEVGPAKSSDLLGNPGSVVFRLAPNSISFHQPIRADVALDLQGSPVVVDGGLGLGRCTIRGSYGVGGALDPNKESPGFANMQQVRSLFLGWAALNQDRALNNQPLLRLVFSIRDGKWSEWRLWQWWAVPTALPTEERTAGRPFEWSYAVSFWCLEMVQSPVADTLPAPLTTQKALEKISGLQALLAGYRDITQNAANLATQLSALQTSLTNLRQQAISEVRGVSDTIRRATSSVNGLMAATNPTSFRQDVQESYRGTLRDTRKALGNLKTWGTTLAPSAATVGPKAPTVQPTGSLQQMAAMGSGSINNWPSLAESNGLRWPFIAIPGGGSGTPLPPPQLPS